MMDTMAFLNKLNTLAKSIGDKTTDAIETTKLNSKIGSEKAAANELFKKIGEFYYNKFTAGEEIAPEILEFCESAKAHFDVIASAQSEIERIKSENESAKAASPAASDAAAGLVCQSCGASNAPGTKFCSQCGAKLEAPQPRTCPNCGSVVASGLKFCGECGSKIE